MNEENAVIDLMQGAAASEQAEIERQKAILREEADVKVWAAKIKAGRDLDSAARKQYAVDRSYCSVDAGKAYGVFNPETGGSLRGT